LKGILPQVEVLFEGEKGLRTPRGQHQRFPSWQLGRESWCWVRRPVSAEGSVAAEAGAGWVSGKGTARRQVLQKPAEPWLEIGWTPRCNC